MSVTQCPPNVKPYDRYFCAGINVSNYDRSKEDLAQGIEEGFLFQLGPMAALNMHYQISMLLNSTKTQKGSAHLKGVFQTKAVENGTWIDAESFDLLFEGLKFKAGELTEVRLRSFKTVQAKFFRVRLDASQITPEVSDATFVVHTQ